MRQITIILILFLLIANSIVMGQPYKSMFGKDTIQLIYFTDFGGADFVATAVYKAFDDTIVSGKPSKFLYEIYLSQNNLYGFISEDTIQGKTWLQIKDDTIEYLIMDLSLEVQDTFLMRNQITESWNQKYLVKEILTMDSCKVIKLEGLRYFDNIKFYEGIGPAFIFRLFETGCYSELLCSYKDGVLIYDNPEFDTCFIPFTLTGIHKIEEAGINIYPNPTQNILTVKVENFDSDECYIEIIDINGQIVFSNYYFLNPFMVDISNLKNGIYLLRINKEVSRKIIINGN